MSTIYYFSFDWFCSSLWPLYHDFFTQLKHLFSSLELSPYFISLIVPPWMQWLHPTSPKEYKKIAQLWEHSNTSYFRNFILEWAIVDSSKSKFLLIFAYSLTSLFLCSKFKFISSIYYPLDCMPRYWLKLKVLSTFLCPHQFSC